MNTQKVRLLFVVALLAVMMVAANVLPAAAQSPALSPSLSATPVPIGCVFQGKSYPLGTVLHFVLPYPEPTDVYMRCELNLAPPPSSPTHWVYYSSKP
jgi:hypothetical protein